MSEAMSEYTPTGITANRTTNEFIINWSDGVVSTFPFALLRNACPCAECRGGHENMRPEPAPDVFNIPLMDIRTTRIKNVEPVGNYAIVIEWEDGHRFGIYNWRYLRALWEGSLAHE
jgi:DUF971 family protein